MQMTLVAFLESKHTSDTTESTNEATTNKITNFSLSFCCNSTVSSSSNTTNQPLPTVPFLETTQEVATPPKQ